MYYKFKKNVPAWFKTHSVMDSFQIIRVVCELILEGKDNQ